MWICNIEARKIAGISQQRYFSVQLVIYLLSVELDEHESSRVTYTAFSSGLLKRSSGIVL